MEVLGTQPRTSRVVVAGYAAIASGILAIPMIAALAAMFAGFALGPGSRAAAERFGTINDSLTIVVYGLLLPVIPAMHELVRETGETRSLILAAISAAGILITMVLTWLLISGVLSFEQQIRPMSLSLVATAVWFVGTGYLAKQAGALPKGLRNGVLGALYLGIPVWGIDLGRRLLGRR